MTEDERAVFMHMLGGEVGLYTQMYTPVRYVISARNVAKLFGFTLYRARKALKGLAQQGVIERVSIGCPAVESFNGEVYELVCDARPPLNGYALTERAFDTDEWKAAIEEFDRDMRKMAEGYESEVQM